MGKAGRNVGTKVRSRTVKVMSGGQCVVGTQRWVESLALRQGRRRPWKGRNVTCAGRGGGRKTHGHQCVNSVLTPTHLLSVPNPPRAWNKVEAARIWKGLTENQEHADEMQTACTLATPS